MSSLGSAGITFSAFFDRLLSYVTFGFYVAKYDELCAKINATKLTLDAKNLETQALEDAVIAASSKVSSTINAYSPSAFIGSLFSSTQPKVSSSPVLTSTIQTAGLENTLRDTTESLNKRGEKLRDLTEKTEHLKNASDEFSKNAHKLKEQMQADSENSIVGMVSNFVGYFFSKDATQATSHSENKTSLSQ